MPITPYLKIDTSHTFALDPWNVCL